MKKIITLILSTVLVLTLSTVFADGNNFRNDDATISRHVKALLFKKQIVNGANFNAKDIHVETKNGVVHLTGKVDNQVERVRTTEIAKSVSGVRWVWNDLRIRN